MSKDSSNTPLRSSRLSEVKLATASTTGYLSYSDWARFDANSEYTDVLTTRGDLLYRNSLNVTARLPIGTNAQVLTSNGLDVAWSTVPGLHNPVTLATNSGLTLSTQVLSLGTPSTLTGSTTNALTTTSHTHAITGFEPVYAAGTTLQYYRGDKSWQTLNTSVVPELTNLYYTDARSRLALSSSSTALTYVNTTGVFSITSGYSIPTTMGIGERLSSVHAGTLNDMSLTDDYLYICVHTGIATEATWKKIPVFQSI